MRSARPDASVAVTDEHALLLQTGRRGCAAIQMRGTSHTASAEALEIGARDGIQAAASGDYRGPSASDARVESWIKSADVHDQTEAQLLILASPNINAGGKRRYRGGPLSDSLLVIRVMEEESRQECSVSFAFTGRRRASGEAPKLDRSPPGVGASPRTEPSPCQRI
jgi:hypothetical protein